MLSVSLFFYFLSDKLAKHNQKYVFVFIWKFSLSLCVTVIPQKGRGVNNVFNSSDLTLSICSVYLCLILHLSKQT